MKRGEAERGDAKARMVRRKVARPGQESRILMCGGKGVGVVWRWVARKFENWREPPLEKRWIRSSGLGVVFVGWRVARRWWTAGVRRRCWVLVRW